MAIGMLVAPIERRSRKAGSPSISEPSATPAAMAAKIHSVR
jgi:hypothetical protein